MLGEAVAAIADVVIALLAILSGPNPHRIHHKRTTAVRTGNGCGLKGLAAAAFLWVIASHDRNMLRKSCPRSMFDQQPAFMAF